MVEHVRRSFHEILRELTWLEDSTKKVAQEKVGAIILCSSVIRLALVAQSRRSFVSHYSMMLLQNPLNV